MFVFQDQSKYTFHNAHGDEHRCRDRIAAVHAASIEDSIHHQPDRQQVIAFDNRDNHANKGDGGQDGKDQLLGEIKNQKSSNMLRKGVEPPLAKPARNG